MKTVYLVTYDICDPRRLRLTFKLMKRFGDHVQFSVFICRLSPKRKNEMEERLSMIIDQDEDQVLIFSIGTEKDFRITDVSTLGRTFIYETRQPAIF